MRFHIMVTAALALAGSAAAQQHVAPVPQHGPGWFYGGSNGPSEWGRLDAAYAACATGQQESPIDLSGAISADLGPIGLNWPAMPGRVFDTGHAIQVEASPGGELTMGGKTYELLQLPVHQPSEHLLNGRRFPLEVHFVHTAPDGTLGVVGVFVEAGAANPVLQTLLDAAPAAAPTSARPVLDLDSLLPAGRDYFRYEGSLTTPPCSEIVDWAVLAQPITASEAQIDAFAGLHPGNTRPLQPLNHRFLLRSGR